MTILTSKQRTGQEDAGHGFFRGERPLRLFRMPELVETIAAEVPDGPPRQFRWRRVMHRVSWAEGPERLSAEWWLEERQEPDRDYFQVEDDEGHRFWLFRKGLYGRGGTTPDWYMHGVFA